MTASKTNDRPRAGQGSLFAAIEAGGTKFVCGIGSGPDDLRITRFPTTTPAATIARCIEFFRESAEPLTAIGIASFGPVDLRLDSPSWGHITTTPKPGWRNTNLAGPLHDAFGVPVTFDTDGNAAALAEHRWGAARDVNDCVYVTVGTGIGGGIICDCRLVHGLLHPEVGHMRIPHDFAADPFPGNCPFHGDCLEGLASGPAIQARWGCPASELPREHPAWDLEARYLAVAASNLACTISPARIILGGGVMEQRHLFDLIHQHTMGLLNGYLDSERITAEIDRYIVPPELGNRAGVLGALALAETAPGAGRGTGI